MDWDSYNHKTVISASSSCDSGFFDFSSPFNSPQKRQLSSTSSSASQIVNESYYSTLKTPLCMQTPVKLSSTYNERRTAYLLRSPSYMDRVIRTNHLSRQDPECLIGRNMGVEHVDVLDELNKRSMQNVLDLITRKLNPSDYANMYCVSKTWLSIIQSDKRLNKERLKFTRYKKRFIDLTKENLTGYTQTCSKGKRPCKNDAFARLEANCLLNDKYEYDTYNINRKFDELVNVKELKNSKSFNEFLNSNTSLNQSTTITERLRKSPLKATIRSTSLHNNISSSSYVLFKTSLTNSDDSFKIDFSKCTITSTPISPKKYQSNQFSSKSICSKISRKNLKRL